MAGLRRVRPTRYEAQRRRATDRSKVCIPKGIQELLGHSSGAFTLQVYGHLFEEAKQETADKLDSVLTPVASTLGPKLIH